MSLLAPLLPNPGVNREGTRYTAEGTWWDCNRIRWRKGLPEKLGGWFRYGGRHIGFARALHDWGTVFGDEYLAVGTNTRLYIHDGSVHHDITPERVQVAMDADWADVDATAGTVQVTAPGNGVVVGDYVAITTSQGTLGGLPQARWNERLHRVLQITGVDLFTIRIPAEAGDTPSSGADGTIGDIVQTYLRTGSSIYTPGDGWGAGAWGAGAWGGSGTRSSQAAGLRLWSLDNFGNDLLACPRGGNVFYWDQSEGLDSRAFPLSEGTRRVTSLNANAFTFVNGSTTVTIADTDHRASVGETVEISGLVSGVDSDINGVPLSELNDTHTVASRPTANSIAITVTTAADADGSGGDDGATATYTGSGEWSVTAALQVMTSPAARHVIAFGANEVGQSQTSNLYVRWSDSENPFEWRPTDTNAAGEFPLSAGSVLIGSIRTRQEIVIFTDAGIVSMRYVGAPIIFAFVEVANGVSMISQKAAVNAEGDTYFMDRGGFYVYRGDVERIPCSVRDYVFSRLDQDQADKIFSGANNDFSEVQWFYPSKEGNGDVDSYVKYNHAEDLWDYGDLVRGAWKDAPVLGLPRSTSLFDGNGTLDVEDSSRTATLTLESHRLEVGDLVRFEDFTSTGVDDVALTSDHPVTAVLSQDQVEIDLPAAASDDGSFAVRVVQRNVLYRHEDSFDDDGDEMGEFVESGDYDIEDGHKFYFIDRFIPDVEWRGDQADSGVVDVRMYGTDFPGEPRVERVNVQVSPTTTQNHIRLRARQMAIRVSGVGTGFGWRFGKFRLGARLDGRR